MDIFIQQLPITRAGSLISQVGSGNKLFNDLEKPPSLHTTQVEQHRMLQVGNTCLTLQPLLPALSGGWLWGIIAHEKVKKT